MQSAPPTRSMRGARSRNALSMRVCHRSGGSKTWESDERTRGNTGISFLTRSRTQLWQPAHCRQGWARSASHARPSTSGWVLPGQAPGPTARKGPRGLGVELAVLARDQVVREGEPRHGLEPRGPGIEVRPAGDVEAAFGHEHHPAPAADIGNCAIVAGQPRMVRDGPVDTRQGFFGARAELGDDLV